MPKVSPGAFAERHPAARLKIAVMPQDEPPTARRKQELSLVARLVAQVAGRWASQRTCQQYFETRRVITAALAGVE
jgi:hypothetical protein